MPDRRPTDRRALAHGDRNRAATDPGPPTHDGADAADSPLARPGWLRDMPFFATSAMLHAIAIAALAAVLLGETTPDTPTPTVIAESRKRPPPPHDPKKDRDVRRTIEIPALAVETPVVARVPDEVVVDIPRGEPIELSSHALPVLGVGGGTPMAGARNGRRDSHGGISVESESAVLAALEWLYRHQDEDGGWKAADFHRRAQGASTNRDATRYPDDRGDPAHDVGVTALAVLAFTGHGTTHRDGTHPHFVKCLRKAVGYLLAVQDRSGDPQAHGRYGSDHGPDGQPSESWIYNHAIATMAMAELLAMSRDELLLRRSVTHAVELCLRAQNPGRGWRYGIQPGDNDTSVTGWMVLALKTAKGCRLPIPDASFHDAFAGALAWIDHATDARGKTGYLSPGDDGSILVGKHAAPYPFSKDLSCMTAVGVLCRLFAGERRNAPAIRQGVDRLLASPPTWQESRGRTLSTINFYSWYYASYALFQNGGKPWTTWNEPLRRTLVSSQRAVTRGDPAEVDGSWDPIGEWGATGGRVYATALGALTLEVYYRYERHSEGVGL